MYLSKKVDRIIDGLRDVFIHGDNCEKTVQKLNKAFKRFNVKFNFEHVLQSTNDYSIGAFYDDEVNRIFLTIYLDEELYPNFFVKEKSWDLLKFKLSRTIQHELIHQNQYESRNFIENSYDHENEKNYLKNYDEIDAYSHDIAMEIQFFYKNSEKTEIFHKISEKKLLESYQIYKNVFSEENWDKIRKKLLKKTYKWFEIINI